MRGHPSERSLAFSGSTSLLCSVHPAFTLPLPTGRAASWVPVPLTSCIPSRAWPSPKYVTLEQLKAMWGTSPGPTAPAPGLPPWASASQDLVPTTCLPPVLPSSSSLASVTPSPQVGGLCVPAPPRPRSPLRLCVPCSVYWHLGPRLAPGSAECLGALAAWHRGWQSTCLWSGSYALFLVALSASTATVFSPCFLLFTLSFLPSLPFPSPSCLLA